jgi:hypothetical protein
MKPETPLTADELTLLLDVLEAGPDKEIARQVRPLVGGLRTQLEQAQFEIQEAKDMHLAAQRGMRRAMAERTALRDELESR